MNELTYELYQMPFANRLSELRKLRGLTQEGLANIVGITKTQIYRYERSGAQPTLDVIKRLAIALSVTTDDLIFEEDERRPDRSLDLLLEGISRLDPDEKNMIKALIEGVILKHQTKALIKTM
jgi:transcriptional regulator with XRE-family HTH domain